MQSDKKIYFNVKLPKKSYLKKNVNLNVSDQEIALIGNQGILEKNNARRGTLGLDIESLRAIETYFNSRKRQPTDVEIETLAQTWSEHCKHKIFSSSVDEVQKGIFETYISGVTKKIIEKRKDKFCVSLFSDNAGAVTFNDQNCGKVNF